MIAPTRARVSVGLGFGAYTRAHVGLLTLEQAQQAQQYFAELVRSSRFARLDRVSLFATLDRDRRRARLERLTLAAELQRASRRARMVSSVRFASITSTRRRSQLKNNRWQTNATNAGTRGLMISRSRTTKA
jgi:siderophore synthetase component